MKTTTKPQKPKVDFKSVAIDLMFAGKLDVVRHGLQFRAGKTVTDVKSAIRKALKNGHAKTEFELSMLEVYLKQVFLPTKVEVTTPAVAA